MADDPSRTGPFEPGAATVEPRSPASGPASTIDATGGSTPDSTCPSEGGARLSADLPTIPGYTVTGEIARGGMGRVLAARDFSFDREVAIKVLLPTMSRAAASRFVTESKITGRLPHPGVPPVHALGELDGVGPYLVMKRVRGRTLLTSSPRGNPIPKTCLDGRASSSKCARLSGSPIHNASSIAT